MDYWKQYANTGGDGSRTGKKKPRQANPAGTRTNKRKRRVGRVSFAKIGNLSDCAQNSGKTPENGQIRGVSDCLPFRTQPRGVPGSKSANGTGAALSVGKTRHGGAANPPTRARWIFCIFARFSGGVVLQSGRLRDFGPPPPPAGVSVPARLLSSTPEGTGNKSPNFSRSGTRNP